MMAPQNKVQGTLLYGTFFPEPPVPARRAATQNIKNVPKILSWIIILQKGLKLVKVRFIDTLTMIGSLCSRRSEERRVEHSEPIIRLTVF